MKRGLFNFKKAVSFILCFTVLLGMMSVTAAGSIYDQHIVLETDDIEDGDDETFTKTDNIIDDLTETMDTNEEIENEMIEEVTDIVKINTADQDSKLDIKVENVMNEMNDMAVLEASGIVFTGKQYIELNDILESLPATTEILLKANGTATHRQVIFGNYLNSSQSSYNLEFHSIKELRYYEKSPGPAIDKKVSDTYGGNGEWVLLSFVRDYDNDRIAIYQNGQLVEAWQDVGFTDAAIDGLNKHIIGTDQRKTMFFEGEIAQVRIWDTPLTEAEIADYLNAELTGNEIGLVHLWDLNPQYVENNANIIPDKVAGGIDATAYGFEQYTSLFSGSGVDFSGGDIELAASEKITELPRTVEAWINIPDEFDSTQRAGVILGNYFNRHYADIGIFSFEIYSNGNPRIYWQNESGTFDHRISGVNVCKGDWVHVALVLDEEANKVIAYVNGEYAGESDVTGVDIPSTLDSLPNMELKIGGDYRNSTEGYNSLSFNGSIAEVRVWSEARSESEIRNNMLNLGDNKEGLIAYWSLEEHVDGYYEDFSVNENHAYIYRGWFETEFPQGDYTFAVLPDTQYLAQNYPDKFYNYTNWIYENVNKLNIEAVIGVGDIVNTPTSDEQWTVAVDAMSVLDGVVTYILPTGNHDMVKVNSTTKNTDKYNQYFSYDKFSQMSEFGGTMIDGTMDNTYWYLSPGDTDFMVLALEFAPTQEVIDWANEIVANHPDKTVIIVTHSYLHHNGQWANELAKDPPKQYYSNALNGDEMWNELMSQHENIALVLCGHIGYPDLVVRTDTGVHGNKVQQILCNAQYLCNDAGGLGLIMLMTFINGSDDVEITWYSVEKDMFYRESNQFTLNMQMDRLNGAQEYELTVVADTGGTVNISSVAMKQGDSIELIATPTGNFYFNGWSSSGGGKFEDSKNAATIFIMPGNDVTVTAAFRTGNSSSGSSSSSSNNYIVRFDTGGGINVASQTVSRNKTVVKPTDPVREGYVFTGWYTDKELTKVYDFEQEVTAGFTLYAGWESIESKEIMPELEPKAAEISNYAYVFGGMDGTFRPDAAISRAEASQMIYNIAIQDGTAKADSFGMFSDVNENDWYYTAIGSLNGWGIVSGRGLSLDGEGSMYYFAPEMPITRAEFVVMAMRYAQIELESGNVNFSDITEDHWAASSISAAVSANIISGYPDGTFKAETSITRAEAVFILNRIINLQGLSNGNTFSDVSSSHWAYEAIIAAATDH